MGSLEEKLQNGDKKAFEQLVRSTQNKVYAVCLNMLKNSHDAQDAAQEAFIKAYRSIASLRGAPEPWLTKIAVNTCLDMLRRRHDTVDIDEKIDLAADETTEAAAEKNTRVKAVREALSLLPPDFRSILVLRDIDGYSYEEIADILSLELGTVRSRISRAREKLKKILLDNRELF